MPAAPAGPTPPSWALRAMHQVHRVILGKEDVVQLLLVALLCQGHVLVDDVPGVGKTTLLKAMARTLSLTMHRVQCTPDLLPSDLTGVSYFHPGEGAFHFRPGPVFTHILLVDEVNRATPRTQSSLLEAMEERQVTVDGVTRPLPQPFWVVATQNPVESQGTYPLPEAQLDRFLLRLRLGYPPREEAVRLILDRAVEDPLESVTPEAGPQEVLAAQEAVRQVTLSPSVAGYAVDLAEALRRQEEVLLGPSPRAVLALVRAARALALLEGEGYVLPDHVQRLAVPVWAHRLVLAEEARLAATSAEALVRKVLDEVPAPRPAPWPSGA
jgi:MoxR-like ATPase